MPAVLLPQPFWFRVAASCPRIDGFPIAGESGPLIELPDSCLLPNLTALDGRDPWARVLIGWNPEGLGIVVEAEGRGINAKSPNRAEGFAAASFWIDTRDTRNVARATRHCHHVHARLQLGRDRKTLTTEVEPRPIPRATADAPLADPSLLRHRATLKKQGWRFELFLPAKALNGFDPDVNRRLGLAHQISDFEREDQFLAIGRDFPVAENPSLWSTLELKD